MEEVRQNLAQIPGVISEVGQPMSHRMDHLLSGTRAQIAIKLFGPDLVTLRNKAEEIRKAMATVPGVVDLLVEPQVGVPQLQININRQPRRAVGLRAADLAETVDTAFNGEAVSQVLENQRTYDVVVRLNDASRRIDRIDRIDAYRHANGRRRFRSARSRTFGWIRDRTRSTARMFSGGSSFSPMSRVGIWVRSSMKSGTKIARDVALPEGYFVQYGGQFEAQEEAARKITIMSRSGDRRNLPAALSGACARRGWRCWSWRICLWR